ncbi:hypothetical protein DS2_17577 [Catenovulum agarivorans DS-2]|uniref:ThuA-like domain-containing protein n=1 Tax=Catenovulum agarivorans DS-2 TaxID=1328313 RepID=W7QSM0_9ALTE|nr:ThuA domain-containing protein [Catenovulum agarivorans]EWH08375.1 hypothetical protein DS2_17577 [Catenovulum agarivorans DS-2]
MKNKIIGLLAITTALLLSACMSTTEPKADKIKVLIMDGQNNHGNWPKSTVMMKQYLEETNMFTVDVARTAYTWKGDKLIKQFPLEDGKKTQALPQPKADKNFAPQFENYDVVISNFGWKAANLPRATELALEKFVAQGGGFVSVHAADNSWPQWTEFNKMIGLGGWGGRNHKSGPWVYYNEHDKLIVDHSPGGGGSHGPQQEFMIKVRQQQHPIMQGMPENFMHAKDELYATLRGPAQNMTILATSLSHKNPKKEPRHEPVVMVIDYGKGRVFHTTLGHGDEAFESVSLITLLQRGVEWAATGEVTQALPDDFPTAQASSSRKFTLSK